MTSTTVKVVVEFPDAAAAVAWFDDGASEGFFPADTDLFKADALDMQRGGDAGTYLVRAVADRPSNRWDRLRDVI